ncbi:hypothetical protein KEM55_008412, partial [Ascosphaera atra]
MADSNSSRLYVPAAFVAGAVLAVGIKDIIYPEIKKKLSERGSEPSGSIGAGIQAERDGIAVRSGPPAIVEGIEGCIGNTHLVRIKSLSEATGCEILAKAE